MPDFFKILSKVHTVTYLKALCLFILEYFFHQFRQQKLPDSIFLSTEVTCLQIQQFLLSRYKERNMTSYKKGQKLYKNYKDFTFSNLNAIWVPSDIYSSYYVQKLRCNCKQTSTSRWSKTPIKLQFDNPKIKLGYQHISFAIFRKFQSLPIFPRSIMTYIQVCHQDVFTEFEVHTYLHFNPKSDQKLD